MLYTIFLVLHNLVRWLVLITAIFALFRAYRGWLGKVEWKNLDRRAGVFFTSTMDLQMLLGLILYIGLSPITHQFFSNISGAMIAGGEIAYFGIEHLITMIIAVTLAHAGSTISRKGSDPSRQHRTAAIFYTLSLLAVIIAIPWWRPLLRI
jgi:hypothetical protein